MIVKTFKKVDEKIYTEKLDNGLEVYLYKEFLYYYFSKIWSKNYKI